MAERLGWLQAAGCGRWLRIVTGHTHLPLYAGRMDQLYFGSQIELLCKTQVRYVGTLYSIDAQNHTVALQNGTCLHTRVVCTPPHLPPSDLEEGFFEATDATWREG